MKFTRTKKLVFFNNKWWVGKTTIAYNTAVKFAEKWYKTVLIDLDPQCNMSRLALWESFNIDISHEDDHTIYGVLKGIIEWGSDINLKIWFQTIWENLSILPGSLHLSRFQDLLITAYNQATWWQEIGYFQTSAIQRYLWEKWLDEEIDIFIIDISPSLDLLNRIILLWTDYFITPLMPDAFSLQGIENLWITLENWKKNWQNTGKALAKNVANNKILQWEWLFIGYVINSYNQYRKQPIKSHQGWIDRIPQSIKEFISEKHCRNGLVEKSWKSSLMDLKDYWELPAEWQMKSKAIFNLVAWEDFPNVTGTRENLEISKVQFEELTENIITVLENY
jgi:cellulose biosynthesis protein BcsQ